MNLFNTNSLDLITEKIFKREKNKFNKFKNSNNSYYNSKRKLISAQLRIKKKGKKN